MTRFQALIVSALLLGLSGGGVHAARDKDDMIGVNVMLEGPASAAVLAALAEQGEVLDLLPEIDAVTLRAPASSLAAIRALAGVRSADEDGAGWLAGGGTRHLEDFASGANSWSLDAIDVAEGDERTLSEDGEGVYVAVIDTGLPPNWREYFPEERIDQEHARAFLGGGGKRGSESRRREDWEKDEFGHGMAVAAVVLGFRYFGPESLPATFGGVAPKAKVIPIRTNDGILRMSRVARAVLYVAKLRKKLKAPIVINMSFSIEGSEAILAAAIDHAIARGVVVVAAAGNGGAGGMTFPARHAPVIAVASAGWADEFPADDPTEIAWTLGDVPEDDVGQFYVAPDSSRALAGQDLDLTAPGAVVPGPWTEAGAEDHTFWYGTSLASPHVAGVAALMLQKNPGLTQAEVAEILRASASPLPADCRDVRFPSFEGAYPTWTDHANLSYVDLTFCWEDDATGHGFLQADAALAATPTP